MKVVSEKSYLEIRKEGQWRKESEQGADFRSSSIMISSHVATNCTIEFVMPRY